MAVNQNNFDLKSFRAQLAGGVSGLDMTQTEEKKQKAEAAPAMMEAECGISVFCNADLKGFTGLIKERYGTLIFHDDISAYDFIVREIDIKGKVIRLEDSEKQLKDMQDAQYETTGEARRLREAVLVRDVIVFLRQADPETYLKEFEASFVTPDDFIVFGSIVRRDFDMAKIDDLHVLTVVR